MITYAYWFLVLLLIGATVFFIGVRLDAWKQTFILSGLLLIIAWAAYYFHFEQMFVKKWGGVMAISVPSGQYHIHTTWKDENLWVENYDPKTNTCIFSEYSKGNLLQGRVHIKNCNPLFSASPETDFKINNLFSDPEPIE